MVLVLGAACTDSAATPTDSELPLTIDNVTVIVPTSEPTPTPGLYLASASQGEALYGPQCAVCHGTGGSGGFAPELNTAGFQQEYAQDEDLISILRNGSGSMPAFGPTRLTDEDVSDLVAYMRSLQ